MSGPAPATAEESIGDVAARFGLETHVLRHWEDRGLLRPRRDGAGRRRYGEDEGVRIAVILRSKAAGMSLDQIAVLLDRDAPDRHRVLEGHLADLERREAEIVRAREMTAHALRCRAHDIASCPRFQAHLADVLDGTARWSLTGAEAPRPGSASPQPAGAGLPEAGTELP